MDYVVQSIKGFKNLVHAETNARCTKTSFSAVSHLQTRFLCVITDTWEVGIKVEKENTMEAITLTITAILVKIKVLIKMKEQFVKNLLVIIAA